MGLNTHSLDLELSSSQYAWVANTAAHQITGALTIEARVKFESTPASGFTATILGKANPTNNKRSYWFGLFNDSGTLQLRFLISTDGTLQSGNDKRVSWTPVIGRWYHLAVVFNPANPSFHFYVDGMVVGGTQTPSNNTIHSNDARLSIGAIDSESSAQLFLDGLIDEVRLWNVVRTTSQIRHNAYKEKPVGTGLVSHWKLNNNYTDSVGGHTLTPEGSPVFSTDTVAYGEIGFDNATGNSVAGTSNTFAHTVSGKNPYLFVFVYHGTTSNDIVTGVTYNGVAMIRLNTRTVGSARAYLYYLPNPATGSNNVVISTSQSVTIEGQATSYVGVKAQAPEANNTTSNTSGTSSSLSQTSVSDRAWAIASMKAAAGGVSAGSNTINRGGSGNPATFDFGIIPTPASRTLNANHNNGAFVWCGAVIAEQPASQGLGNMLLAF